MSELAIPKGRVRIPELVTYILIGAVVMVLLLSMPARLSPQEQCAAEGGGMAGCAARVRGKNKIKLDVCLY